MGIQDFRDNKLRFVEYNNYRVRFYEKSLSKVQQRLFNAVPLLFHYSMNNVPGYIGKITPCGIKKYQVDESTKKLIKNINNKINLDEIEDPVKLNIEALYLQEHFKTGETTLWVIYEDSIQDNDVELLNKKSIQIEKWLQKSGFSINITITSKLNIANNYYDKINTDIHIDKRFFLEEFYTESILLAGKPPLWWLIGDAEEGEELAVNGVESEEECIDFESFNELRIHDYYSAAIWYLLNIANAPVTTWLELSLLLYKVTDLKHHESYSSKLKIVVYAGYLGSYEENPRTLYASYVNNVIKEVINEKINLINNLFVQVISHYYHCGQKQKSKKSIFDYLYEMRASSPGEIVNTNPSVEEYMASLESMYKLAEDIFLRFQVELAEMDGVHLDDIKELNPMSDRLISKLQHSSNNIHILSNPDNGYFSQDRVVIKYNKKTKTPWVLSLPEQGAKTNDIKSFDSVVELLVWSYVNQVLDTHTQILADCSVNIISSMDVVNTVRLIAENIDLNDLKSSDLNAYVSKPVPIKSLVFVDKLSNSGEGESAQIHQLIIYNNGEFYTQRYTGYDQFISCVYNWFNLVNHSSLVQKPWIKIFAIKPGSSQELRSSMDGLLHELGTYFDSNPISNTRTILKNDDKYYVSHITDDTVLTSSFNDLDALYEYLEKPLKEYTTYIFTETFEQDAMLSYLLSQNKKCTMQLFYYIESNMVRIFVFDANGALFTYKQELLHRQSFLNSWITFLNNMNRKYAGEITVEFNQLIKLDDITYEHVPLTGKKLPSDNKFYTMDLKVANYDNNVELTFTCDNKIFSSLDQGVNLYSEISKHVSQKLVMSKNMPVYISDIDVPDELLGDSAVRQTYLIDYLKYKRNVEQRLIDKISCFS